MPPKILLPQDVVDQKTLILAVGGNCTHPAGHCYGNDGGSGIPDNLKVSAGQGETREAWTLDATQTTVLSKEIYNKCQYCGKYVYAGQKIDEKI